MGPPGIPGRFTFTCCHRVSCVSATTAFKPTAAARGCSTKRVPSCAHPFHRLRNRPAGFRGRTSMCRSRVVIQTSAGPAAAVSFASSPCWHRLFSSPTRGLPEDCHPSTSRRCSRCTPDVCAAASDPRRRPSRAPSARSPNRTHGSALPPPTSQPLLHLESRPRTTDAAGVQSTYLVRIRGLVQQAVSAVARAWQGDIGSSPMRLRKQPYLLCGPEGLGNRLGCLHPCS